VPLIKLERVDMGAGSAYPFRSEFAHRFKGMPVNAVCFAFRSPVKIDLARDEFEMEWIAAMFDVATMITLPVFGYLPNEEFIRPAVRAGLRLSAVSSRIWPELSIA